MNCRQGDLAYVFESNAGNYGRVVTCLKLHPAGYSGREESLGPVWEIDVELKVVAYGAPGIKFPSDKACCDAHLRPLRGDLSNEELENPIIRETETC